MKHYPICEPPQIAWDGRHVDLHFLAPHGTTVVISMPTVAAGRTLECVQFVCGAARGVRLAAH
jgi:hypothetical protein